MRMAALGFSVSAAPLVAQKPAPAFDWARVARAIGRQGVMLPGGVMKFAFPRSDLSVSVGGVGVRPALALGSWVAFKPLGGDRVMAMGDVVLTQDEVSPVLTRLQQGGVQQTALHNHLLMESPRLMYMHVMAMGDAVRIATTIRAALALSKTPLGPPPAAQTAAPITLDTAAIARALGHGGSVAGGVYQVGVPRAGRITDDGVVIPPSMGVATSLNFQPLGDARAAITGDFVLAPGEVNPVIRALRAHNITVTALHSHMLTEKPRIFFMHFWATGDAVALAHGLRSALNRTASVAPVR